ncbi:hypothetical protein ES703_121066 [subsurface metagenome]
MTKKDILLHARSPQVKIAIPQAKVFLDFNVFIDIKRRCPGWIQYLGIMGDNLNISGRQFRVLRSRWTEGSLPANPDHILAAHLTSYLVTLFCYFRVEGNLNHALSIAQVNENQSPVVTATVNPTGQSYLNTDVFFPQLTTAMTLEQNHPPR